MRVAGEIRVPGDKSVSHRALVVASLAEGASSIRALLDSADVRSTAGALRAMGCSIVEDGSAFRVRGRGLHALTTSRVPLDCGNSGTTTRLLAGVAAALPFSTRFVGDASLSRRPMRRVARPLSQMGAVVELEDGHLPMTIAGGALRPLEWTSDVASAQVKSAILLAGLVAGVPVTVREPARSRDHTERMLRALGVALQEADSAVSLRPAERLPPFELTVPGDPSSAAFFIALALLAPAGELRLPGVMLNETRSGFLHAARRMGGEIVVEGEREEGGEPVGSIIARPSTLRAVEVSEDEVPAMIDELPMLACMAARAQGTTTIRGAAELRVKESDRIAAVVSNLRALGVSAEELPDGLVVTGGDAPLRGRVVTHGDHRIAMAFGVLGALPGSRVEIDDPSCVDVSYPSFWHDLRRAARAA